MAATILRAQAPFGKRVYVTGCDREVAATTSAPPAKRRRAASPEIGPPWPTWIDGSYGSGS